MNGRGELWGEEGYWKRWWWKISWGVVGGIDLRSGVERENWVDILLCKLLALSDSSLTFIHREQRDSSAKRKALWKSAGTQLFLPSIHSLHRSPSRLNITSIKRHLTKYTLAHILLLPIFWLQATQGWKSSSFTSLFVMWWKPRTGNVLRSFQTSFLEKGRYRFL